MQAGVWQRVHETVLRRLREHDQIIWDRASIDAAKCLSHLLRYLASEVIALALMTECENSDRVGVLDLKQRNVARNAATNDQFAQEAIVL